MHILSYIRISLAALEEILKAGASAQNLFNEIDITLRVMRAENRDPSLAEWQALNRQIDQSLSVLAQK